MKIVHNVRYSFGWTSITPSAYYIHIYRTQLETGSKGRSDPGKIRAEMLRGEIDDRERRAW